MSIKELARRLTPGRLYHWGSARIQTCRRLFIYPETARLERAPLFASVVAPGDRVLDVGLGDGAILRYLVDHRQVDAFGVDVSEAAVDFCRQQGLAVERADLAASPEHLAGGPWDYVIFSELLEHVPEPETTLEAFRPRVRKAFLVSVPNTGYITHRLRLVLGRFPLQWVVRPGEHLRSWTIADFRWWSDALGFEIAQMFPYQGVRGLRRLWPSLFAAGVVYVLKDTSESRLT